MLLLVLRFQWPLRSTENDLIEVMLTQHSSLSMLHSQVINMELMKGDRERGNKVSRRISGVVR
uniref:Pseudouridine-metabolizing bifunctional protein C1861.05 n=1 Tax=Rhizophora mucronata TaxID=61149 RepID=A0A2P2KQB3_RHIMU